MHCSPLINIALGLYSLSGKTSYRKISWNLEAARFGFKFFQSLWNLAGTSAALLPRCLSNFRAIRLLQHPISRLRDFTRFGGKTSYRLVNRGPCFYWHLLRNPYIFNIKLYKLCTRFALCFALLWSSTKYLILSFRFDQFPGSGTGTILWSFSASKHPRKIWHKVVWLWEKMKQSRT